MPDRERDEELYRPQPYLVMELESMRRELERLRNDVRNPNPPYVTQAIFEEVRKTTGERIGSVEDTLRTINRTAWAAIVIPIFVGVIIALMVSAVGVK